MEIESLFNKEFFLTYYMVDSCHLFCSRKNILLIISNNIEIISSPEEKSVF